METNKDLILRQIQIFSDFLLFLTKHKTTKSEDITVYVNNFLLKNYNISFELLIEKNAVEIEDIISTDNIENINHFASILFLMYKKETNKDRQNRLSNIIIHLYQSYQTKSGTYSFEIQSKINYILEKVNIS